MINIRRDFMRNKMIYFLMIPVLGYFIVFCYGPMAGIIMAFQEFTPRGGLFNSPWVGFKHFRDFFSSVYFVRVLRNTVLLSLFDLLWGFPVPIIFALLLNEVKNNVFKKTIQTISYLPYFISLVIICGLVADFTTSNGAITNLVVALGGEKQNLLGQANMFRTIYVGSNIWQSVGFSSIIYLAALSSVDQELYESAIIDGAGRLKQTWYITLPCIASTIIILLIIRMGTLFYVGSEKILLLYSPVIYETADVISTFVYRKGLQEFNYGYSTAVNLFNSIINTAFLLIANKLSRKYSEISLF